MTARVPCCVPYCRRTFKAESCDDGAEVMCGAHYRLASPVFRRRRSRLLRRLSRTSPERKPREWLRLADLQFELWGRIKAQAIERAAGL